MTEILIHHSCFKATTLNQQAHNKHHHGSMTAHYDWLFTIFIRLDDKLLIELTRIPPLPITHTHIDILCLERASSSLPATYLPTTSKTQGTHLWLMHIESSILYNLTKLKITEPPTLNVLHFNYNPRTALARYQTQHTNYKTPEHHPPISWKRCYLSPMLLDNLCTRQNAMLNHRERWGETGGAHDRMIAIN